jgi:hypothetical protein
MDHNEDTKAILIRLEAHAVKNEERTKRLECAIIGDPEMGNKGIVKRIEDIEKEQIERRKKQDKLNKKMVFLGAAGSGVIFGIKGLWEKIVVFFNS